MFSYQDQNHQTVGPVPTDELRRLIGNGAINGSTLLRREGTDFWLPAAKCEEFSPLFKQIEELTDVPAILSPAEGSDSEPSVPSGATPTIPIEVSSEISSGQPEESISRESKDEPRPGPGDPTSASEPAEPEGKLPRGDTRMFFLIGGDGREYGPVSAEQVREWIGQRRADERTMIRRQEDKEFSALGAWPEFAASPAGTPKTEAPRQPPPLDSARADQLADEIIGRGINLSVGSCFSRSWKLYTGHFGLFTGTTAIVLVILTALHSVPAAGNVVAVALGGVLAAGLSLVFLKTIRGQKAEVNDLFAGFNRGFVPLLLASTLVFILVSAGLLLCLLPGIYLVVAWMFVYPLIFERLIDFWPAMELSRKVVHERWWELFALALGATALFVLGLMLAVIGVFFTTPIAFGAIMYAYEDIFGEPKA